MIKTKISLLLTLFFCFLQLKSFGQEFETSNTVRVTKIEVILKSLTPGMSFDTKNLLNRLKTKEGCVFSQTDFDDDLKAMALEFDRIEPILNFSKNSITITLELWLKPVIRNIIWKGNCKIDTDTLAEELNIASGTIYERHNFNEAFHKIKTLYLKKGYFEAELMYSICQLPNSQEIDIEIYIKEGRAGKIKSIRFVGFCPNEEEKILEEMVTKEYSLLTSWFDETGIYNQEALEHDELSIINYLQDEGYADARVSIQITSAREKDAIDITITACKGERYYFGDIFVSGNQLFDLQKISDTICLVKGSHFSPAKIREAVRSIQTLYGSKGYIEATAAHEAKLQDCTNIYNVRFDIEEGEQFRVGLIKIFGNTATNTRVLLHESLLIPGQVFDIRKLKATEARLNMIGFFKCVNVYAVKSTIDNDTCGRYRDVHIEVEETTTGNVGVFGGYSTNESLFGGIELTENNFNHNGLFSLFSKGLSGLRGNGEYLQLRTSLGLKATTYCLRWAHPYFMDSQWLVGFDAERSFNRNISSDYDVKALSFRMHGTYPINQFIRYNCYYRYQNSGIEVKNNVPPSIQDAEKKSGVVSAVGNALSYDSTDNPTKPCRGFRSSLSGEYAGLGGDFHFLSMSYLNAYYHPVSSRGTLKLRLDCRFIQPLGHTNAESLPLAERYFLGGDDTVRGYRPFALGPHFANGDPTGGISSFLVSEEYLHRLFKRVEAFVFFDAGSISLNKFQIGPLKASYGAGFRIEVMNNIPLIVGMGWPVNAESRSEVKRFFLSLGGRF